VTKQKKHAGDDTSIRAVRLSKWYGKITAVSDVSLQLGPGIWGLLGPNGSGKTTFLRMVAGQIKPSLGKLLVGGEKPFGNPRVLRRIGYVPEADSLYDELTGLEFVSAMAELSGYDAATARTAAKSALEEFGLAEAMAQRWWIQPRHAPARQARAVGGARPRCAARRAADRDRSTSRQVILDGVTRGGAVVSLHARAPRVEAITDRVL
jgi:ABC-2 type transport system ATP-binding protein